MIQRDNLGAFCGAVRTRLELSPEDRWFQLAAPSFDVFLEETLPILTAGGAVIFRPRADPLDFESVHGDIERAGATVVEMTTQYWVEYWRWLDATRREPPRTLRALVVGGERMEPRAYRAWQGRYATPLVHVYGITETSCTSTMYHGRLGPLDADVPVGPPLDNTVLRAGGAAAEMDGEIGLAGSCVGRGYLRAPALTAERFRPDAQGPAGSRVYATGDYGYVDAQRALVFRSRRDDQVKVRGHRIRLSTVEMALESVDGVLRAAVLPDPQLASGLVAFVIWEHDPGGSPRLLTGSDRARIRAGVQRRLASWAVPGRIFALDTFPRNAHGKVDREALRRLAGTARDAGSAAPRPGSALPDRVVSAFRSVLQAPEMQPDDNFFDFGGDSLLALALAGELAQATATSLSAAVLFDAPTPRALSEHLAQRLAAAAT